MDQIRDVFPETLVLPVSGHGMVEEIGIMLWLTSKGYKPEYVFGASGGALAGALGLALKWDYSLLSQWIKGVKSFEVLRERPFSYLEIPFRKSIFTLGQGLLDIFSFLNSPTLEQHFREHELLISTQNITKGQLEIFSTVTHKKSVLNGTRGPLSLFGSSCIVTFLGDYESNQYRYMLNRVLRATSAIPIIFEPININGNLYVDGGVSYSSPLNPLMSLQKFDEVIYVFPNNIENSEPTNPNNTIDIGQIYLSQVSRSNYIHDRINYLQNICGGDFDNLQLISGESDTLITSLKRTKGKKRMVELFPKEQNNIHILHKTDKADVIGRLMAQMDGFKYRIFYVN